ncbi:MAG: Na(+)/H(+) antiporter subunit C [Acidimicrobiia bacterium]
MKATVPLVAAYLFGVGTYLILQRTLTRILLGLALMGHGANLFLLLAGGSKGTPPILPNDAMPLGSVTSKMSDPLPQAFVLTAIVIGLGTIAFVLALAYRNWTLTASDEVEDDIEDRRIATREPEKGYIAEGADRPPLLAETDSDNDAFGFEERS